MARPVNTGRPIQKLLALSDRELLPSTRKSATGIGVRAIFWRGGWIDFARKIWGSARKMNSRTNMIKQDETRKLDYIDCGKSLKNYIYIYIVLLSSIFVKHALNSHFRCPKNCSIARKKNYYARLWGAAALPAFQLIRLCLRQIILVKCIKQSERKTQPAETTKFLFSDVVNTRAAHLRCPLR